MRFESPFLLLLALPALAAVFYAWLSGEGRRPALTYPGGQVFQGFRAGHASLVRVLPYALKALALLLAVFALARPQKVIRQAASLSSGVDILLVLDVSTSMRALDFDPLDRMSAAKNAARSFIQRRVSDRIGILVFAGVPLLTCPLTLDYGALLDFLDDIDAGMTQTDGTAIGDGIAAAVSHIKDSQAKSKILILLTDGANNTGLVDPLTAAKTAQTFGLKIYTIGTGRKGPAVVPVNDPHFGRRLMQIPDELDEDMLTRVAADTAGRYFRAHNLMELQSIYGEIDRLERSELRLPPIISYTDYYSWLLVPAALLLAAAMLLPRTVLLRLP
ncbi:MAG: VWA domain-containing protein [Elusimicrobia bacterium]|nr:VWA domain-containing protein [Elusimicrobiota bacterium]